MLTSSDKLFLVARTEIFGDTNTTVYNKEGTQYEYYKTEANRIKTTTEGVASTWWIRTPFVVSVDGFYNININGENDNNGSKNLLGVAFAFCF